MPVVCIGFINICQKLLWEEGEDVWKMCPIIYSTLNRIILQLSIFRDMPCSLRSQLQRMFVPESASGMVSEDDLIVTSDVDTFVMRPDIFEELLKPENRDKISILQVKFSTTVHLPLLKNNRLAHLTSTCDKSEAS